MTVAEPEGGAGFEVTRGAALPYYEGLLLNMFKP